MRSSASRWSVPATAGRDDRRAAPPAWTVNHKRVYRLMREDNLLCLRRRKFVVTTDSDQACRSIPTWRAAGADRARSALGGGYHLHPLEREFVYLAVILDAFSRRVIGWALDRTLDAGLTLGAFRRRWRNAAPRPAWCITPTAACSTQPATTPSCSGERDHHQHEPERQSLRQRHMRIVYENAEVRRGLPHRISRSGRRARLRSASSWKRSTTRSACTRRSAICRRQSSRHTAVQNQEAAARQLPL